MMLSTDHLRILPGIVILWILVLSLGGCDSFLTKEPTNAISSSEFFQTADQAEQAVIGIYAKLQDVYEDQWRLTEIRSDNTSYMWNAENRGPHHNWEIDEFTGTPSNPILQRYWGNTYEGIQRANALLNNINTIEFDDTSLKERLISEARFLRALFYFNLVRLFGRVPLVLEQVQAPNEAFATLERRADIEEVYKQILENAGNAADLLPPDNPGRATEGAARMLLAEIYLTRKKYQQAINELERVTELGYSLAPRYSDIFDLTEGRNEGIIFSVNYAAISSDRSLGTQFIYWFSPHNSDSDITGDNEHTPDGLNIPSIGILNAYEPNDERREVSVNFYVDPSNEQHGIAMGDTILYIGKYDQPHSVRGVTGVNWPIYRYAGTLLMMAEALNEIGQTGRAYPYINKVRNRAGLSNLPAGLSQAAFRKAVYHEQRVELAFENHRWFNLLRTGRAIQALKQHAEVQRDIQPHWREPAYVIEEFKLKYPIPQRVLTLNPELEQNPGY